MITSQCGKEQTIQEGVKVRIREGVPRYQGRVGVVTKLNFFSENDPEHKKLWYVNLTATKRAKARTELFFSKELELLD
jgi:hypothetical protein